MGEREDITEAVLFGECRVIKPWRDDLTLRVCVGERSIVWEVSYASNALKIKEIIDELSAYRFLHILTFEIGDRVYGWYQHDEGTAVQRVGEQGRIERVKSSTREAA